MEKGKQINKLNKERKKTEKLTQSKSKTIITRSMLTISLIVFTDPYKDMFLHFIANGISLHSNYKITNKVMIHMGIQLLLIIWLTLFY